MEQLLFIYNADSGKANAFLDAAHKIFRPSTYSCYLCKLTHGPFAERKQWKDFRRNLAIPMEFLHKDEFEKQYASKFGYKFSYPVVLISGRENLEIFITSEELKMMKRPEELIALIRKRYS